MKSRYQSLIIASILIGMVTVGSIAALGNDSASPRPITAEELDKLLADPASKVLLVDVRTAAEYKLVRIPGAALFPYDEIERRKAEFAKLAENKDRKIVVYCRSGRRSSIAATTLVKFGYTDVADLGSITNWKGKLER